ncbi:protein AMBP-like [Salarias fasciatus]|uniref:protein AMBP-like n=1 Tax=Salarias fasciatus TaxID=181472 RepID=UPI001176EB61|nr:protein AMBP-like [Salarias fasciatus]
MQRGVYVMCVLFSWSPWSLQVDSVLPENLNFTQENFVLSQFMGKWYEVAVASTCPHYTQRKRGNPVTVALELTHKTSESNFTMAASSVRNGSCQETSTVHSLTDTPGRFFHHVARFGADVDSIVVRTNYNDHAVMFLLSTEKLSEEKTIIFKLYSRSVDVSPAVLEDFKTLIRLHGMNEGAVIVNQYEGECAAGEEVTEPTTQPQDET